LVEEGALAPVSKPGESSSDRFVELRVFEKVPKPLVDKGF
jgi:hypothetical protein